MSAIMRIPNLRPNHYINTDVYKDFHDPLYVPGLSQLSSYFHSRGGQFETATLYGLQGILHRYWMEPMTMGDISEAEDFNREHHIRFDRKKAERIVTVHGGYLPLRVRAIPEGLCVPTGHALMTVESMDPEMASLESLMETSLVRLWQASTVATVCREVKKLLLKYLKITSDTPEQDVEYMYWDFGARAMDTLEMSQLSGSAPILSFKGTDTKEGVRFANHYYSGGRRFQMVGIPATEHSTTCSWGRAREFEAVEHAIRTYLYERQLPPGIPKIVSCVGDTYDIYNFTHQTTSGKLIELTKNSGGKFVNRPDSGEPTEVLPKTFNIAAVNLGSDMGMTSKGYRRLPPYYGFLQGDKISLETLEPILQALVANKICIGNYVFGSGGGLHQIWQRDDQKWKFACSAAKSKDGWVDDVRKDPITDPGKQSRAGRLDLIQKEDGSYETVDLGHTAIAHPQSVMNTVYETGQILYHNTFSDCQARMAL